MKKINIWLCIIIGFVWAFICSVLGFTYYNWQLYAIGIPGVIITIEIYFRFKKNK